MKTLQISIPDELESRLRALATERGISVEDLLLQIAEHEFPTPLGEVDAVTRATPPVVDAEIEAARARLLTAPVRPLPPGKDFLETIQGLWPGTETDEQIREALERMS